LSVVASRYVGAYDKSVRANPWLHIGLTGVGALAVGYLVGRAIAPSSSVSSIEAMARNFDVDVDDAFDE
jgi:hypothetical protein